MADCLQLRDVGADGWTGNYPCLSHDGSDGSLTKYLYINNKTQDSVVGSVVAVAARSAVAKVHPLYASRPAAGFPAPGDDMVEKVLDLNDLLIAHPVSTFFVRVEGDSMQGVGIFSGDILVVDRAVTAEDNKIVVAAVYGELVVKRFVKTRGGAELVSENAAYAPIKLQDSEEIFIWGVVVGSVRKFQ